MAQADRRIPASADQSPSASASARARMAFLSSSSFYLGRNAEAGHHRESGASASHLIMAADKRAEIQVAPRSADFLRIVGGAKNDRRSKSGFSWHVPATQWRFPHREVGPLQQLPGGSKVLYGYPVAHKGR